MKMTKFLLLAVAFFAFSCSSDDEEASSSLEKQTLSLTESNTVVVAPAAMQTSEDTYAQQAVGYIQMVNQMSSYLAYMKVPDGAAKTSTRITAANGRVDATGDVVVYTWSDAQSGYSVAYQISETSDSYAFEIFITQPGQTGWLKYFHAEEKKDRSSGFMNIYDVFGFHSDDTSVILLNYKWGRSGDIFTFTLTDNTGDFKFVLNINEKTKAGDVVYYLGGVKAYEMEWNAQGNGSWVWYDQEGNIEDSGTWTV
jgi:hypothetical protein